MHHPPSWPSTTHLRPTPTLPPPLIQLFRRTVLLSDGSSFTIHHTAPAPSRFALARDITNNPLWAPGTDVRGQLGEEGRVGRFRRRYAEAEGTNGAGGADAQGAQGAYGSEDLGWMSEGATEEVVGTKAAKKKR